MVNHIINITLAYLLDRIIGDPKNLPHPVIYIGKCISILEKAIRSLIKREKKLKIAGLLFPIFIVGGTYVVTYMLVQITQIIHPLLATILEIVLIATTIASKGLADAALEIYQYLKQQQIKKARKALSMIVGRDTEHLDEEEISRGTIETVAENIVDAIISPLFYAFIGGAPLAMAYRAANTLDSMVGYKNDQYQHLGWASARFDDVLNYIPARLTAFLIMIASVIMKLQWRKLIKIVIRDAKKHPSPNSGYPESAVAAVLGIQLGGTNYYQGVISKRAKMGDATKRMDKEDILLAVKLMKKTSTLFVIWLLLFALICV